uniref:RNA helicase n=1 Tax=Schmidtea mediterranea TaxID=79327 RepID=H9CXT7_SCHMD|nr:VASA-1 [Schmidtea mediterranea]ANE21813.1 VASA 1 protein [Schmidtea mediterranea]
MSVNDGLSDEEWGAWGQTSVVTENISTQKNNSKPQNGFGSDDEVIINTDTSNVQAISKFSVNSYNKENNLNGGSYEKRGGFNGNRGTNRFATRKVESEDKNETNGDRNYNRNGYSNDRDTKPNYQNNRNSEFKRNGNEQNNYPNDRNFNKRDNSPGDKNQYANKRNDSRERSRNNGLFDDSRERKTPRGDKRDDSRDRKINRDDSRDRRKYRDDSRDRRKYRDDSRDRKKYRDDSRDRKKYRDDSNRKKYRDSSMDRRKPRDDSRDHKKYRDDSRDKRNNLKRRDDSYDNNDRNRRPDRRNRDDSRENRKKRDDSQENRTRNRKEEFKRDESWEDRRSEFQRDQRINNDSFARATKENGANNFESKKFRGNNDANNGFRNDEFDGNFQGKRNGNSNDFSTEFDRTVTLEENPAYSSKTFVRGQKQPEQTNQNDDAIPIVKRATFIPDDNQEDYELHVNSGINFDNYDKIPVEVTGDDVPPALNTFSSLHLPEFLTSNVENLKYTKLTPVQKYAIPIIDSKRDLMACAQTGSGKTAAFLIPIIKSLSENGTESPASAVAFPKALIMAPTRELCRQIFTAARHLCRGSNIKCAYIYGGIEMNKSRRNIQATGCDILVATPGRLIHFLELVWLSLRYLQFFVLDEADRMLDSDGFYESVTKIYNEANFSGDDRSIQISMFSATFPNEIQTLARNLLKNYLFLAVGVVGSANSDVKQEIIQSDQREKVNTAIEYIKTIPDEKTLIFVESKRMADFMGIKLGYLGFKATTIHGDREQEQREIALNDFKSGRVNFMVATNVAARGLDIPKVDNVINIDMPDTIDTYVHRIGRTGRCGNVGRAISFFDEMKDIGLAQGLVSKLQEANQECPDWLRALCDGSGSRMANYSRDTRKNVKSSKYIDNPTDDGFMKGTNIDYDDVKPTSEWLED